ncbi:MAG: OmpA family protein [Bacteroidaceae bacterium]|nr:OmpA family protein [Bacteroidaceae bacterium]
MKRLVMMVLVLVAVGGTTEVNAQSFLKKLGKKIENAAKNAIERNAERKTEEAVDKVFNGEIGKGKKDKDKQNNNGNNNADAVYDNGDGAAQVQPQKGQSLEMTYAKSDFVPGDEIIFEDLLVGEKLGEFPSMWDLKEGNAEVVSVGGENAIHMGEETLIMPYMKEKDYLPEEFTIEFDLYVPCYYGGNDKVSMNNRYNIDLVDAAGKVVFQAYWYNGNNEMGVPREIAWRWHNGGEESQGEGTVAFNMSDFNHIAISFNKRALKFYVNGIRIANIPRCDAPTRFQIFSYSGASEDERFIKNVRIAKGAVPLYDRMMSDGKFITYGITFDVGKATIKPESMGEINRIVQLMNENPTLKFSVEGHTDSTGNAASNQTLSEQRSQAIVAKLVELGIAQDRLTAVGKGQNSPIADNNTDEGRAKNRRVEFVKQ